MKNRKSLPVDIQTRLCAVEVVEDILLKKQNFDGAFDSALRRFDTFEGRDVGFIRELTMQLLRRLGQVDFVLQKLSDRPLSKIEPQRIVTILRVAAAQMLFMDVKDHAAVDTAVRLGIALGFVKQKGFINGILRSLGRQQEELLAEAPVRYNTPGWLYKSWVADYGEDVANKIVEAHLKPAPVDITVKSDAKGWAEKLGGELLSNDSIRLEKSGRIPDLEGYSEGAWWVQSAAAAMPAQLMTFESGDHIVDLCAAPGGKTMQLAARGAKVTAVDISRGRLERLKENLERCGLTAEVEASDGKVWKPKRPVDAILIDAPCSATGTIRHQPDVMHLKQPADVEKLIETQKAILKNAATFVKKGGEIIYCTCSLQKSESEKVVEWFLNENNNFALKPYVVGELSCPDDVLSGEGYIRLLPFHAQEKGGMDGFFIARVIRT